MNGEENWYVSELQYLNPSAFGAIGESRKPGKRDFFTRSFVLKSTISSIVSNSILSRNV